MIIAIEITAIFQTLEQLHIFILIVILISNAVHYKCNISLHKNH